MRRRAAQPWLLAGTALAAVAALSGCGIPTQSSPQALPRDQVPGNLLSPTVPSVATTTTVPSAFVPVHIFLLGSANASVSVVRNVTVPASMFAVMNALVAGPTTSERASGITSAMGADVRVLSANVQGGVATVDFNLAFGLISGIAQIEAVSQVVFTATDQTGVTSVAFEIVGSPADVPTANGVEVPGPVSASDYASLASSTTAP